MRLQFTSIIRNRGQLTIPDEIRELRKWATPTAVVTIVSDKPDEIVIKPHTSKQTIDWDELWNKIYLARSFRDKGGNLSGFIAKDREER